MQSSLGKVKMHWLKNTRKVGKVRRRRRGGRRRGEEKEEEEKMKERRQQPLLPPSPKKGHDPAWVSAHGTPSEVPHPSLGERLQVSVSGKHAYEA